MPRATRRLCTRTREYVGEIEPAETHVRAAAPAGSASARRTVLRIVADLVVHLLLLWIAQDVVGFLDLLETILRGFVAGIEIGMMLARKLTVSLADIVRGGVPFHPESFVKIHFYIAYNAAGRDPLLPDVRDPRCALKPHHRTLTSCRLRQRIRHRPHCPWVFLRTAWHHRRQAPGR